LGAAVRAEHLEAVESATLEWVGWFNNRRILSSSGDVPPAEYEHRLPFDPSSPFEATTD